MKEADLFDPIMTEEAKKRGFLFHRLNKMFSFCETDKGDIFFSNQISQVTSAAAQYATNNKWITKLLLKESGINTPEGRVFGLKEKEIAWEWLKNLDFEVAVKPLDSLQSKGVSLHVKSKEQLENAWSFAKNYSKHIIVEKMSLGNEYRLFILDGKIVAGTQRIPPQVKGDGIHTIAELIEKKNQQRKSNPMAARLPIKVDHRTLEYLQMQDLTMDSVLQKDQEVVLSSIKIVIVGGEQYDITDYIHPGFKDIAKRLFHVFPLLSHVGIDMVADDISLDPSTQNWDIFEVNVSPSIPHHYFPIKGEKKEVAGDLLDYLYKKLIYVEKKKKEKSSIINIAPLWEAKDFTSLKGHVKREVLYQAAKQRGLKVVVVDNYFWFLEDKEQNRRYFYRIMSEYTSIASIRMTNLKYLTSSYLRKFDFSTPKNRIFNIYEQDTAWEYAKTLKRCVVKPFKGSAGTGVFVGIEKKEDFYHALKEQTKGRFIVEEFMEGDDHRLLIIDGQFVAALKRTPAFIIGDGVHTLKELINIKNKLRKQNFHNANRLIRVSSQVEQELKQNNITLQTVIQKGEKVFLQKVANLHKGGEAEDVTDLVHKDFQRIAVEILNKIPNLFLAGVDIITKDISKDPKKQKWAVIELNANPGIQAHHFPVKGKGRDVAGVYIDALFRDKRR